MAKEEVKQAVAEETEVATAEAEVAEATEETTEETATTDETANADEDEELSPWYYFFSQGCGWCKKSSPVVEELIDDGHDILMLDLAEPDNQALNKELQEEYNTRCGTPWFVNADTGKQICGFREKDILEKWLAGEDIPAPPRPTGPPPKTPFHGSTDKENKAFKKEYDKWLKDNEHMGDGWSKQQPGATKLLENPRPKSDPPMQPNQQVMVSPGSDEAIDKWAVEYKKWLEVNDHLPQRMSVEQIVNNMKQRSASMKGQGAAGGGVNPQQLAQLEAKIDRLMAHLGVK